MIEARDLSKNTPTGTPVRNVRFTVAPGEVVGVIGPQGSGKSTLLKMLAGLITPSSGEGVVAGLRTARDPFRIKNRVGYVAGDSNLPTRATPRELFTQQGEVHGVPPEELEARIEALVNAFELEQFVDLPVAL